MLSLRPKLLYYIKVVVFGQEWLYSGKSGCFWAKVAVFGESACIWAKVVVFGQLVCTRAKVVVFVQGGCIRVKWLFSGKTGFSQEKVVGFVQKRM